jgi:sulfur carrier protein
VKVVLNGEDRSIDDGAVVRDAVLLLVATDKGVAVSVDRTIVPRSQWGETKLHHGAVVEVLVASSGG